MNVYELFSLLRSSEYFSIGNKIKREENKRGYR